MNALATSYVNFSSSAITIGLILGLIVLIGVGATRSVWMGFFGGGCAGLMIFCVILGQSGGIFAFIGYGLWIPVVVLASAAAGTISAGIGKWIGTKLGKDPWDHL